MKAQISGEVFTYIMAAIIISLIMIVGYIGVQRITDGSQGVHLTKFENSIRNDLLTACVKTGSVRTVSYTLPPTVDMVCFYGTAKYGEKSQGSVPPLVLDMIDSYPNDDKIFVIGDEIFREIDPGCQLDVDEDFITHCVDTTQTALQLKLLGNGRHVTLTW
jgi:hypothetical protein